MTITPIGQCDKQLLILEWNDAKDGNRFLYALYRRLVAMQ